jgi:hypothetical protein
MKWEVWLRRNIQAYEIEARALMAKLSPLYGRGLGPLPVAVLSGIRS